MPKRNRLQAILKAGDAQEEALRKAKFAQKKPKTQSGELKQPLLQESDKKEIEIEALTEAIQKGPTPEAKEYFNATMEALYNIDAHAYTPARIIHVFLPEVFQSNFLEQHGNIAVMLLAIFLAILGYHERITEIEDKLREERGDTYILTRLIEYAKKQKDITTSSGDFKELIKKHEAKLKVIAEDLFRGYTITLAGESYNTIKFYLILKGQQQELEKEEEIKKEHKTLLERIIEWRKKHLKEKIKDIFILISDAVGAVWNMLSTYSMFYWIVWMAAILMAGAALTPALGFGLPAIIPALFLIWKATDLLYNKNHPKTDKEINTEFNKLLIFRAYADQLLIDELLSELELKYSEVEKDFKHGQQVQASMQDVVDSELEQEKKKKNLSELFKNLFKRKAFIITYAVASALVTGYVVALFAQWPIMDLLTQVFHVSLASTATLALSIYLTFGIALGIGIFLAIKQGIEKHEQIQKSRGIAEQYAEKSAEILELKKQYAIKRALLKDKLSEMQKNKPEEYKRWSRLKKLPDLEEEGRDDLKTRIRRYIAKWVTGAGSGVFVIRSVILAGCILPLLLGPISWSISFGVAMAVGFVWGTFKVFALMQENEEAREREMLKTMPHLLWNYKKHIELLDRMIPELTEVSKSAKKEDDHKKTAKLVKRADLSVQAVKDKEKDLILLPETQSFGTPRPTLSPVTKNDGSDGNKDITS